MRMVKLGDVVTCLDKQRRPVAERDRTPGNIPYYGANGQQGWIDSSIFDESLIIVAEDGGHFDRPERGVAYAIEGPSWVNNHGHVLRPSADVSFRYIYHVLRNYNFLPFVNGSTRSKLTQKQLLNAPVPLPELEEQRRIAAILDKADEVRAKRQQMLDHLDTLPQAIFHDMFADGTSTVAFGELITSINAGKSLKCAQEPAPVGEWGILKLGAVTYGTFKDTENKHLLSGGDELARFEVRENDVLMTRKNTPELVGAVAVVRKTREKLLFPDLVFRISLEDSVLHREYFQTLMMCEPMRSRVKALASGSAASMSNISTEKLKRLHIPVPPISTQDEFAEKKRYVLEQRERLSQLLVQDEALIAALQAKAFRGELQPAHPFTASHKPPHPHRTAPTLI